MKTLKSKLVLFLSILSFVFISSCSNDESIRQIDENSIANGLTFKKIDISQEISSFAKKKFWIVAFDEWGRKSKNCGGWGLCDAKWFFCTNEDDQEVPCENNRPSIGYSTLLELDSVINKYYVDILLGEPTDIPEEDLTFYIDESFDIDTEIAIGKDLIFPKNVYLFDYSLGDYGGIRIYLD